MLKLWKWLKFSLLVSGSLISPKEKYPTKWEQKCHWCHLEPKHCGFKPFIFLSEIRSVVIEYSILLVLSPGSAGTHWTVADLVERRLCKPEEKKSRDSDRLNHFGGNAEPWPSPTEVWRGVSGVLEDAGGGGLCCCKPPTMNDWRHPGGWGSPPSTPTLHSRWCPIREQCCVPTAPVDDFHTWPGKHSFKDINTFLNLTLSACVF